MEPTFEKLPEENKKSVEEKTRETLKAMEDDGFIIDLKYGTELEDQLDDKGEKIQGRAFWLEMKTDIESGKVNHTRSGKLFLPKDPNGELVCFYAGLPGEDTMFREKRYANELTKNGYTVWSPRHNGTKLNQENGDSYIGSQEVLDDQMEMGKTCIGGPLSSEFMKDFAEEPYADLSFFKENGFGEITLIGHSFGATSIINSIKRLEKEGDEKTLERVKKAILINGMLGDGTFPGGGDQPLIGGMRLPGDKFVGAYTGLANKYFEIKQPLEIAQSMQEIIAQNHEGPLPENIELVISSTPTDAYLTLEAAEKYFNDQKSALLIADLTEGSLKPTRTDEQPEGATIFGPEFASITPEIIKEASIVSKAEYGGSQHSGSNFKAETLRRLVEVTIAGKHEVAFSSEKTKQEKAEEKNNG